MTTLDLPVVDVGASPTTLDEAATEALTHALRDWGFVAITGHGVPEEVLQRAYAGAAAFFDLPRDHKRRWERPELGRQRGYTGFGVEHARDRGVHDLKEFWQTGPALGPDHPLVASGLLLPELAPTEPAGFAGELRALYDHLHQLAVRLLDAIVRGLELPDDGLVDAVCPGNSVLRVIHYPPIRDSDPQDAVRAAAHEDINLLTLLPVSTQPGLELLDRTGTWRALRTPADVVLCDTGDLMHHLSQGRLPATTHRVVNPAGAGNVSRYSVPFFCHPRPDWVIGHDAQGRPTTAGEHLERRLRENRVL